MKKKLCSIFLVIVMVIAISGMTTTAYEHNVDVKLFPGCCSQDELEPLSIVNCCWFPNLIPNPTNRLVNFPCSGLPEFITPLRCLNCNVMIYICAPRSPRYFLCTPRHYFIWRWS